VISPSVFPAGQERELTGKGPGESRWRGIQEANIGRREEEERRKKDLTMAMAKDYSSETLSM